MLYLSHGHIGTRAHRRSGGGGSTHRGVVLSSEYADLCAVRLRGDGQDLSCRLRRAGHGTCAGRERRVRRTHGQGGVCAHPRWRTRRHGAQPHLHARRGHRGGRERRGHLRALSALCQKGEDRQRHPSHRVGRDEYGLGRRPARSFILRRQVPVLRRSRPAAARGREQHAAHDARHYLKGDRAAGKGQPHRAARRAGARGRAAPLWQGRVRGGHSPPRVRQGASRAAVLRSRSDHRRDQPHARRRQP